MSAKELLFASAQLGTDRFYGLPDPFYGMTQEQVYSEIPKLQSGLESRGLARQGFDGSFALTEEVKTLIAPCAQCQQYLLFRSILSGGGKQMILVYSDDTAVVEVECQEKDVALRALKSFDATPRALGRIRPVTQPVGEPGSVHLLQSDLVEARASAIDRPADAREMLRGLGCSAECASLLAEGFRREADFYLLVRADLKQRTLSHAMAVQGSRGGVWLLLEDPDQSLWEAEYLPGGVAVSHLQSLCNMEGARR